MLADKFRSALAFPYFAAMFRFCFLCLFFLCLLSPRSKATDAGNGLRISMLTCGTGDQIWEIFGHSAIRVTDSIRGIDEVYNYGTFDGYAAGFEQQFIQGKLLYYLTHYPYQVFLQEYAEAGRSITEQLLVLNPAQQEAVYDFLRWNALKDNRYYLYDFFYDNCATRIRDIFPEIAGAGFCFGATLPQGQQLSFRQIINRYFYKKHFERVGVNLLLGSGIDKIMSHEEIMFLPDYLQTGIAGAITDNGFLAAAPVLLLEGAPPTPEGINWVFLITVLLAVLVLAGHFHAPFLMVSRFTGNILLLVTGLLGSLMLVMWLGTDHQACRNNYNLLWALPTNLILAFAPKKKKGKYAVLAMVLIFVSLFLHLLKVQELPFLELAPLLLALLTTFAGIYQQNHQTD